MSLFPLDRLLDRLITTGSITLIDTDGSQRTFGPADADKSVTIRINDPRFMRRFARRPGLAIGEGYVDGSYSLEDGRLQDTFDIVMSSAKGREPPGFFANSAMRAIRLIRRNDGARATQNVRHHYDIDHALYETFLDEDMQYSCAYWRDGVTSLDQAQHEKKEHIARKLRLEPGMRVLDIGSGWGGMALHLAREYGVDVTGVTLSSDQYETSLRRAQQEGLTDKVTFKLLDYRDEPGTFDRIVSVGMFEHVGRRNFGEFFDHIDRLLKPDGVALLHTIGRNAPPAPINVWMSQYIFPGAYLPSLSELAPLMEERGLWLTDYEMLRLHYAKTLAAWNERFQAHRAEIAKRFDERFCRMWEFYLLMCEAAFIHRTMVVFQIQIAKEIDTLPITRDYMYADAAAPMVSAAKQSSDQGADRSNTRKRASTTARSGASKPRGGARKAAGTKRSNRKSTAADRTAAKSRDRESEKTGG